MVSKKLIESTKFENRNDLRQRWTNYNQAKIIWFFRERNDIIWLGQQMGPLPMLA